jgi:hypothetical protein
MGALDSTLYTVLLAPVYDRKSCDYIQYACKHQNE